MQSRVVGGAAQGLGIRVLGGLKLPLADLFFRLVKQILDLLVAGSDGSARPLERRVRGSIVGYVWV